MARVIQGASDLTGEALSNYITALLNDWKDAQAKADHPVTWAVDKGPDDITHLMRYLIAEPICNKLESDAEIRARPGTSQERTLRLRTSLEPLPSPTARPL